MRALCGAIISAGALIGLGLLGIGLGYRYTGFPIYDQESNRQWVHFKDLDTALMLSLVVLLAALAVGLGVAFLGLAYHHHHRGQELLHLHRHGPTDRPPSERMTL